MNKTEIKLSNGEIATIIDTDKVKVLKSENYNFLFNKSNGFFARWGKTEDDDGDLSVSLPEILDLEISSICEGVGKPCSFCYKSNTKKGNYMTFETFKKIFDSLPVTITQIAFGTGDVDSNPDMWKMFEYCRNNDINPNVVPNITLNGARMIPEYYDKLANYCGAIAISLYDKDLTYNAIYELTSRNMTQINIHYMLADQTYERAFEVIDDMKTNQKISKMSSLVFLSLKQKGNAKTGYTQLSQEKFNKLCDYVTSKEISYGFDSCSSMKVFKWLDVADMDEDRKNMIRQSIEPCEATVYSNYISCGDSKSGPKYYPCSFAEGLVEGIDVLNTDNFMYIWRNEKTLKFKDKLIGCGRNCPLYEI